MDPFGHSTTMATLYSLMGMNSWYFGRADWGDRDKRTVDRTLEMIMQPSASLGPTVDIFTGITPGYGSIPSFNWDQGNTDEPIQDDPALENYNVKERVLLFLVEALGLDAIVKTGNVMINFGGDFEWENANTYYVNMDQLIHYLNMDGRVNAFYSTPTIYTNAKHAANFTWTTKSDDFFPYASLPHVVWSGYFTSRPALKGYVRTSSNFLQACRQLEIQQPSANASSLLLWESMGIAQHHDAVSGTSKQHVADDYARRLSEGLAECKSVRDNSINAILSAEFEFSECPFLNESICNATSSGQDTVIVLYNALGQNRTESISVPVPNNAQVTVTDFNGDPVPVSIVALAYTTSAVFSAFMPAAGFSTYFIQFSASTKASEENKSGSNTISNAFYTLTFNEFTGRLSSITNRVSGVSSNVDQTFAWFNATSGELHDVDQASGAYIFRPYCAEFESPPCPPIEVTTGPVNLSITATDGVQQAEQVFSPWVSQTIRLYENQSFIEVTFTVGPIPFQDGFGREVVSVWTTDLEMNQTWYTDANGREMQERRFNYRPTWKLLVTDPVSDNFFPVDSSLYIQEPGTNGRKLVINTDRAQGGGSIQDGQVMLMVHRRLLHDDNRGVAEALNETGTSGLGLVVTGTQRITLDTVANSAILHKWNTRRLTFAPLLSFTPLTSSPQEYISSYPTVYSALQEPLPINLHLLTLQDISVFAGNGTMILRIDHSFEVGEDPVYSQPVAVQLDQLFTHITLLECRETTLTANQDLGNVHRYVWRTEGPDARKSPPRVQGDTSFDVLIYPMEIRTWSCSYQRN